MNMLDDPGGPPSPDQPPAPEGEDSRKLAEARFRSCRWHAKNHDEESPYCTHRDVLPFAGTTGFKPEAWCPDCAFYKLRRTPKKRERSELEY